MIRFGCPTCKGVITSDAPGSKFPCPHCGQRVQVPQPPPPPPQKTLLGEMLPDPSKTVLGDLATVAPSPAAISPGVAPPVATLVTPSAHFRPNAFQRGDFSWVRRGVTPSFLFLVVLTLALPWTEIRCAGGPGAGKTLVSQSGLQAMYGGYSVDSNLEALAQREKRDATAKFSEVARTIGGGGGGNMTPAEYRKAQAEAERDKLKVAAAPLLILFALVLLGAIALGFLGCIPGHLAPIFGAAAAGVTAVAVLLLAVQVVAGFPLEEEFTRKMAEKKSTSPDDNAAQALAAMMFEERKCVGVYLAFAFQLCALLAATVNLAIDLGTGRRLGARAYTPP